MVTVSGLKPGDFATVIRGPKTNTESWWLQVACKIPTSYRQAVFCLVVYLSIPFLKMASHFTKQISWPSFADEFLDLSHWIFVCRQTVLVRAVTFSPFGNHKDMRGRFPSRGLVQWFNLLRNKLWFKTSRFLILGNPAWMRYCKSWKLATSELSGCDCVLVLFLIWVCSKRRKRYTPKLPCLLERIRKL